MNNLTIKNILFYIDFSEASMNALYTATCMARKHKAHMKLLFVQDNSEKFYPQINLHKGNDIIKALATLAKLTRDDELVSCSFSYMIGDRSNCIIEVSNTDNADLIIMAKNSSSRRDKTFPGTTSYAVVSKGRCPVLLVPSGKAWTNFSQILFPVRPALCMIEKFTTIKEIVKKDDSQLYMLNLRNPAHIKELHIISKLVQLLKKKIKEENIQTSISYYFRDENFAEKILSVAHDSKNKIDLLVITSDESDSESLLQISAYTQKIIHNANIPVLILKSEIVDQSQESVLMELEKQLDNC